MTFHSTVKHDSDPKTCTVCGVAKSLTSFRLNINRWTRKDGTVVERKYYAPQCKACDKKRHADWYQTPKGKAWSRKYEKGKFSRLSPSALRRHKEAARQWQRDNGSEYRNYVRYLKPLLK